MDSIMLSMNAIFRDWKSQYDIFNAISQEFSAAEGMICFDSLPLCQIWPDMELLHAAYDADSIDFQFNHSRAIQLQLEWPEDSPPVVAAIAFLYQFIDGDAAIS